MKLSTWLLNRKLYFHKNAEPISSVKTKKALHLKKSQPLRILRTPTVSNGMMIKTMARYPM